MDIAKYITTAALLASVFRDMGNTTIVISAILAATFTLVTGLYLVRDVPPKKSTHKKKK